MLSQKAFYFLYRSFLSHLYQNWALGSRSSMFLGFIYCNKKTILETSFHFKLHTPINSRRSNIVANNCQQKSVQNSSRTSIISGRVFESLTVRVNPGRKTTLTRSVPQIFPEFHSKAFHINFQQQLIVIHPVYTMQCEYVTHFITRN